MRIAAYQFPVTGNISENYNEIKRAIDQAKGLGVQLLVFPECALTGYPPRSIPDPSGIDFGLVQAMCDRLQKLSYEKRISLVVGSVFKEDRIYNRAILFQPGRPVEHYDKRALWGWDRDHFSEGTNSGLFEIEGVRFGVRICFEVRFPEYFRELYNSRTDVDLVLFFDVADAEDHERYELIKAHLRTRAVENVTTVISVNAAGPYQTAPTMAIGKSGQCIRECSPDMPELLVCDYEKTENDFGENGRKGISDMLSGTAGRPGQSG